MKATAEIGWTQERVRIRPAAYLRLHTCQVSWPRQINGATCQFSSKEKVCRQSQVIPDWLPSTKPSNPNKNGFPIEKTVMDFGYAPETTRIYLYYSFWGVIIVWRVDLISFPSTVAYSVIRDVHNGCLVLISLNWHDRHTFLSAVRPFLFFSLILSSAFRIYRSLESVEYQLYLSYEFDM